MSNTFAMNRVVLFRASLIALFIAAVSSISTNNASAQMFPYFPQPATGSPAATLVRGVSLVNVPVSGGGNLLYAFYANSLCEIFYAQSTDGTTFPSSVPTPYTANCNATTGSQTSGLATAIYNGNLYLGYVESGSYQFVVVEGTPIGGGSFSFTEVARDTTPGNVTTGAGIAVAGNNLVFVYGTARNPSNKNEGWTTYYDGTLGSWNTHVSGGGLNVPT